MKTKHKKEKRSSNNANVLYLSVASPIFSFNFQGSYCKPVVVVNLILFRVNTINKTKVDDNSRSGCNSFNIKYEKTYAAFSCVLFKNFVVLFYRDGNVFILWSLIHLDLSAWILNFLIWSFNNTNFQLLNFLQWASPWFQLKLTV